jgi:predicted phage terminase large subunit-like protein
VDLALGKNQRADWNATVATALDESTGIVYYRDMLRVHELDDFMTQAKSWMLSDAERGVIWGVEDVNFQTLALRQFLKDKDLAAIAICPVSPDADKVSRARAVQTRSRQGLVRLVRGSWNQAFITEALSFPGGVHDDQIDTASGGLQMIADGTYVNGVVADPFAGK